MIAKDIRPKVESLEHGRVEEERRTKGYRGGLKTQGGWKKEASTTAKKGPRREKED